MKFLLSRVQKDNAGNIIEAAVYTRISTDEDLQKWSLRAQVKELQELAGRRGYKLFAVYSDTVTGSKSSRPGLDRLRDDMAAGRFQAILVVDQDRLSRMEPIDWELLKREIREAGVRIITPIQEIDFSDEDNELVSDVFNLFARHQRRKIKKAMQRGRAEATENGIWLGSLPYGRKKVTGADGGSRIIADPETQWIIQRIFAMYAGGLGIHTIAMELNRLNIPTSRGGKWDLSTVHRVLTRPMHRGDLQRLENGRKIYIEGAFEPTVQVELFDRCRRLMRERREGMVWQRAGRVTGLATGILVCQCGKKLNINTVHTGRGGTRYVYHYYRHRTRRNGKLVKPSCPATHSVIKLDLKLINAVKLAAANPELICKLIRLRDRDKDVKHCLARLKSLENAYGRLLAKKERLLGLYLSGDWDRPVLDKKKLPVEAELRHNLLEQSRQKNLLKSIEGEKEPPGLASECMAAIMSMEQEMTRLQQQSFIQALFPRVEVALDGELIITSLLVPNNSGG